MDTFAVDRLTTTHPYSDLPLWTGAFEDSFHRVNTYDTEGHVVLDTAGGTGLIGGIVNDPDNYYLIDLDQSNIDKFEGKNKVCGSVEDMPYDNEMFDIIICQSALQYLDKEAYFKECHRVLKPGGYLCLHENGAYNPFINVVRGWRKILTLTNKNWKEYDDTIKGYLTKSMLPTDDFELIYEKPRYLFSTISWIVEYAKFKKTAKVIEKITLPIDKILMQLPLLNKLGFLNVYHLKKK